MIANKFHEEKVVEPYKEQITLEGHKGFVYHGADSQLT